VIYNVGVMLLCLRFLLFCLWVAWGPYAVQCIKKSVPTDVLLPGNDTATCFNILCCIYKIYYHAS